MTRSRTFCRLLTVAGCAVGAVVGYAPSATCQTPIVQWTFDEAAGGATDAEDVGAPPATNGVFGPTATRTTDVPGGGSGFAVDLSAEGGDTSIINGGLAEEVDTLTQFTFTTWAKVTGDADYNNDGGSGNVRLLSKQIGSPYDGFSWNMNPPQLGSERSNNAFTMGLFIGGQGGFAFSYASDDILDRGGEWLFLAVTYDGTQSIGNTNFYLGDETGAVAPLGTPVDIDAGAVFSTIVSNGGLEDADFGIGFTGAAPGADVSLDGYQDDVRVYDSVLDLSALDAVRLENLGGGGDDVDRDGDGDVDGADFVLIQRDDPSLIAAWEGQFGAAAAVSAVPEPATLLMLALAIGAAAARQRARR